MASQQTFTNSSTENEGHDVEQSVLPWSQDPAPTEPRMPSYQHNFVHNGMYPLYALPQQQQVQQQRQQQSLLAFQQLSQPLTMQTWPSLPPSVPLHLPIESRMPLELSAYQPFVPIPLPTHYTYSNMTLGQEFGDLQSMAPPNDFTPEIPEDDAELARATSVTSNVDSITPHADYSKYNEEPRIGSRSASPNADEMAKWGVRDNDADGAWACAYPGCTSRSRFRRGCDLRKHYKRHSKNLFCRHVGCPQATERGFSSKKDRDRHEAKHDPQIVCEVEGCTRVFSRPDNMKDHVRRMHTSS